MAAKPLDATLPGIAAGSARHAALVMGRSGCQHGTPPHERCSAEYVCGLSWNPCDDPACDRPACESVRVHAFVELWRELHPDAPDLVQYGEPYRDSRAALVARGEDTRGIWNDYDPHAHAAAVAAAAEASGEADKLLAHLERERRRGTGWIGSTHKLATFDAEVALVRRGVAIEWRDVKTRDPGVQAYHEARGDDHDPFSGYGHHMELRLADAPAGTQETLTAAPPPAPKPVPCPACAGRSDQDHRYGVWAKHDGSDPIEYPPWPHTDRERARQEQPPPVERAHVEQLAPGDQGSLF